MEKIKVNITYNKYSKRYYATACGGRFTLCNFHRSEVSEKSWYFDAGFMNTGNKFLSCEGGEDFPLVFFLNLLKSKWFLEFGVKEFPEIEFTKSAKKLLNIQ